MENEQGNEQAEAAALQHAERLWRDYNRDSGAQLRGRDDEVNMASPSYSHGKSCLINTLT